MFTEGARRQAGPWARRLRSLARHPVEAFDQFVAEDGSLPLASIALLPTGWLLLAALVVRGDVSARACFAAAALAPILLGLMSLLAALTCLVDRVFDARIRWSDALRAAGWSLALFFLPIATGAVVALRGTEDDVEGELIMGALSLGMAYAIFLTRAGRTPLSGALSGAGGFLLLTLALVAGTHGVEGVFARCVSILLIGTIAAVALVPFLVALVTGQLARLVR